MTARPTPRRRFILAAAAVAVAALTLVGVIDSAESTDRPVTDAGVKLRRYGTPQTPGLVTLPSPYCGTPQTPGLVRLPPPYCGTPQPGIRIPPPQHDGCLAPPAKLKPSLTPGPKGRYHTLLRKIAVPADRAAYGDFCDYGYYPATSYAGHKDIPAGYWVYLHPHWYIYKGVGLKPAAPVRPVRPAPRNWGPEQATGAPNTPVAGDKTTAWASATADGQKEWLELTYAQAVQPLAVLVYETYNPGALTAVSVLDADGRETCVWSGTDPTGRERDKGVSVIPFQTTGKVIRVRLYIDSPAVKGWNEIDAVGLLDDAGKTHWATHAAASSSYPER